MKQETTIYCGDSFGAFHPWIIYNGQPMDWNTAWWFPEIDYGCHHSTVPRHPRRIIELVPDMVGKRIVTMSEHIILAFQKMVRDRHFDHKQLSLYCGATHVFVDEDGNLENWPGDFFPERLDLL